MIKTLDDKKPQAPKPGDPPVNYPPGLGHLSGRHIDQTPLDELSLDLLKIIIESIKWSLTPAERKELVRLDREAKALEKAIMGSTWSCAKDEWLAHVAMVGREMAEGKSVVALPKKHFDETCAARMHAGKVRAMEVALETYGFLKPAWLRLIEGGEKLADKTEENAMSESKKWRARFSGAPAADAIRGQMKSLRAMKLNPPASWSCTPERQLSPIPIPE